MLLLSSSRCTWSYSLLLNGLLDEWQTSLPIHLLTIVCNVNQRSVVHKLLTQLFCGDDLPCSLIRLPIQAAVSEYCAAADAVGVPPPAYIQLLAVDLLLQQEQHYQAVQLLYSQPNCGSAMLAQHLLEVAGKDSASGPGGVSSILAGFSGGPRSGLVTQGGNLGPRVQGLGGLDASPGSAMALELALDVTARQAVPELRPIGGKFGGLAGSSDNLAGGSNLAGQRNSNLAGQKVSTAAYVRQLLGLGQVLQAARIARTAGGVAAVQVPAREFLEVAAAAGDAGAFAAVYRVMRPQLVGTWPDFEAARSHFLDAATAQG